MGLRSPKSGFDSRLGRLFFRRPIGGRLEGEVAEAAEKIIRETCKELDIEIIDMAGKLWGGIYPGRRVTRGQILYQR